MRRLTAQAAPLQQRQAELQAELNAITRNLNSIQADLSEIQRAAQAIGLPNSPKPEPAIEVTRKTKLTIKQAVREILSMNEPGLSSGDILELINEKFFENKMERTSLSPQLSRLRKDGDVALNGNIWSLTYAGKQKALARGLIADDDTERDEPDENDPPDAGASSGSEAGSDGNLFD